MTDLTRALEDIADIRNQIAAAKLFRGFGPAVVAATGGLAIVTAALQSNWSGLVDLNYFAVWIVVAILSVCLIGLEMFTLSKRHHGPLAFSIIWSAVENFLPVCVVGLVIGAVMYLNAPEAMWILPGIWQMLIALGLFAALKSLPYGLRFVAAWYFLAGTATLIIASQGGVLSPWLMGVPFGGGQLLMGYLLYTAPEKNDG